VVNQLANIFDSLGVRIGSEKFVERRFHVVRTNSFYTQILWLNKSIIYKPKYLVDKKRNNTYFVEETIDLIYMFLTTMENNCFSEVYKLRLVSKLGSCLEQIFGQKNYNLQQLTKNYSTFGHLF
jgi:hypothetical protein